MSRSLVKDSVALREALQNRIKELGLSYTDVCRDSVERGYKIDISAMSRYFKNSDKNKLSEEDIVWLSIRYCIFPSLSIGVPTIEGQQVRWMIPQYNEQVALKMLEKFFPVQKEAPVKNARKKRSKK